MTIVLFRVDERLIHGQVVIGWGHQLRPDRYVVVDDALAESDWEQELYSLGAGGAEVAFLSSGEAPSALDSMEADDSRTIVLTRDVATMRRLAEHGSMRGRTVNFGGLHHGPERRQVLTYVHLSPAEIEDLRAMVRAGVGLQARDLPDAPRVDLAEELELA